MKRKKPECGRVQRYYLKKWIDLIFPDVHLSYLAENNIKYLCRRLLFVFYCSDVITGDWYRRNRARCQFTVEQAEDGEGRSGGRAENKHLSVCNSIKNEICLGD